jgi:hypothetical protein
MNVVFKLTTEEYKSLREKLIESGNASSFLKMLEKFKEHLFPDFVRIEGRVGSGLRLEEDSGGIYIRDGGAWHVKAHFEDDRLVVSSGNNEHLEHVSGRELVECTREEWAEDNGEHALVHLKPGYKEVVLGPDDIPF